MQWRVARLSGAVVRQIVPRHRGVLFVYIGRMVSHLVCLPLFAYFFLPPVSLSPSLSLSLSLSLRRTLSSYQLLSLSLFTSFIVALLFSTSFYFYFLNTLSISLSLSPPLSLSIFLKMSSFQTVCFSQRFFPYFYHFISHSTIASSK